MTEQVEGWIRATRALARAAGVDGLASELTAIGAHAARPGVRVAVLAEQSAVRTLTVNQLLGRQVLPVKPTVDLPILIVHGREESLEAATAEGWRDWPDGITAPGAAPGRVALAFRLGVPSEVLDGLGVELVGSPPRDGLPKDGPAGSAWLPLADADAVVLALSGTSAMTRSDLAFVEELLQQFGAARILLLLTRLDQVDEDDRAEVLAFVQRRAAVLSAELAVVPEDAGSWSPEEVGTAVRSWLAASDLPGIRRARIARRVVGCLRRIAEAAADGRRLAEAEAASLAEARNQALDVLDDELRVFDELRLQVQAQHNLTDADFRRHREKFRGELTRDLAYQADHSADPKAWWEKDLGYQLDTRLAAWRDGAQQVLDASVRRHVEALDVQLAGRFGTQSAAVAGWAARTAADTGGGELPLTDLRQRKVLYRMGPTGVAVLAALLIPGIGPLAALSASLVGTGLAEVRLRGMVEEQRALVRGRLPGVVDTLLDADAEQLTRHLEVVYRHLEDEVLRLRSDWRARPLAIGPSAAGSGAGSPTSHPDWADIADRAETLIGQVRAEAEADTEPDAKTDTENTETSRKEAGA